SCPGRVKATSKELLEKLEKSRDKANQRAIQDGFTFQSMTDRYQEVADGAETTFEWLFNNDSEQLESSRHLVKPFNDWLENGDGIFHISGKPGSGKSTLMKFLCKHRRKMKNLVGLIRALVSHIALQQSDTIPDIFPDLWDPSQFEPWDDTRASTIENDDILGAFQRLLTVWMKSLTATNSASSSTASTSSKKR
ncbi:hypothetical protein B0H67DRAFT_666678, partial [Lasiosphaeris hirsuta]